MLVCQQAPHLPAVDDVSVLLTGLEFTVACRSGFVRRAVMTLVSCLLSLVSCLLSLVSEGEKLLPLKEKEEITLLGASPHQAGWPQMTAPQLSMLGSHGLARQHIRKLVNLLPREHSNIGWLQLLHMCSCSSIHLCSWALMCY